MAHLLSPHQLGPYFLWSNSCVHPGDEKMIKHIGAFGDEAVMVPSHGFNQAFDEFLAELLHDLGSASAKQTRRMAECRGHILPAVDNIPEPIEYVGTDIRWYGRLLGCWLLAVTLRRRTLLLGQFHHATTPCRRSARDGVNLHPADAREIIG